jgi:hypothetical protein
MKPKGTRHSTIPIDLGGQFSSGDVTMMPQNSVRVLRNYVVRPNRFECRAPFVYDSLDTVNGFAVWQDIVNEVTVTNACRSADNKLYPKNASGTGYAAGVSGLPASARLTSFTNMLGKVYMMFDNGAGVPTAAAVYDGTTISTSPFNSAIAGRSITSFIDRNFIINPRVTFYNLVESAAGFVQGASYNFIDTTRWHATNVNTMNITSGTTITGRIAPTSTSANACYLTLYRTGIADVPAAYIIKPVAATSNLYYTVRMDVRGVDAIASIPITLELYYRTPLPTTGTSSVVGDMMISGGYRYRCTVAGTTALVAPSYSTTIGATTVDGNPAIGTITLTGVPTAAQTFVVGAQTFAFQAGVRAGVGQVQIGIDAATTCTNIIAAINLDLATVVATQGGGTTVVVTAATRGTAGNALTFTTAASNQTMTGSGTLGGAGATQVGTSGCTWTTEGTDVICATEYLVSPLSVNQNWSTIWAQGFIPPRTNTVGATVRIKLYTTAVPACATLAPIDVAFRDGLADGNPAKANHGIQVTAGDFYYPFYNLEITPVNAASINIDSVIWSEINNPKSILAANTYPLTEIAGLATASIVTNGRLVIFKRKGMWIFKGVADPYEPILPETSALQVGCLGPRALDTTTDGYLYWIGDDHVYRMNVGTDTTPTAIDSPGMYEEIMARDANWVENQSTYNLPLLVADDINGDIWIYTQKGKIYIYHVATQQWSWLDAGDGAEVAAMIFDSVSLRMLVSFGGQSATRFDETSNAQDTIVTGGGTGWDITSDIVPRPFELFAPRYEATLLEVGLFHLATIQNGSLTLSYSYDRGATWTVPSGYPLTSSWITSPRIRMALAATGPSVTIKIGRTGAGGARNWSVSKADALLRVHRGEIPFVNPA